MSENQSNIAPEIIACMAEGRDPTVHELTRLAARIASEVWGRRSAFAWGGLTSDDSVRLISLRLAHVALIGQVPDKRSSEG